MSKISQWKSEWSSCRATLRMRTPSHRIMLSVRLQKKPKKQLVITCISVQQFLRRYCRCCWLDSVITLLMFPFMLWPPTFPQVLLTGGGSGAVGAAEKPGQRGWLPQRDRDHLPPSCWCPVIPEPFITARWEADMCCPPTNPQCFP